MENNHEEPCHLESTPGSKGRDHPSDARVASPRESQGGRRHIGQYERPSATFGREPEVFGSSCEVVKGAPPEDGLASADRSAGRQRTAPGPMPTWVFLGIAMAIGVGLGVSLASMLASGQLDLSIKDIKAFLKP